MNAGQLTFGAASTQIGGETVQVQTVYCGFCGGRIAADDVFCAHCGARQPMAGLGSSATLRAARPTAKLVVAGTTELDASFVLQKDNNLLGRTDPHSNVFPGDRPFAIRSRNQSLSPPRADLARRGDISRRRPGFSQRHRD